MKYKIQYERTELRTMIVEAENEQEARKKYEEFDVIEDNEEYGLSEQLISIRKVD